MHLFQRDKQFSIYFHCGVEQMVRFLEDDDENDDDFVSVSTYSQKWMPIQIQENRQLDCFLEQLLKNQCLQIDALGYR